MIDKESVKAFFDDLPNCDLDPANELLYGYFFTDTDKTKLLIASKELEKLGYKYVDIFDADVDEDDEPFYFLHVEKIEIHSVDSLLQRNSELYSFADKFDLDSYDGFDVGPRDGSIDG